MSISQVLARFSSSLKYDGLPPQVQVKTLDLLADWLANAAAGLLSPFGRALHNLVQAKPDPHGALLAGQLTLAEPLMAALVNAGASHCLEFDDSDRIGLYHPGAPVISAAWSAAAIHKVGGQDFLAATVAGYEVSQRLARAINPDHYRIWHTTGTVGALGAAVAAAKALGLNSKRISWAIGLGGTQAAGLWEVLPQAPLAKNLHPAKAAHAGLLAALLSRNGIPGPTEILEGRQGFFAAMVPKAVKAEACFEDLGRRWLILDTTIKAYPVCGHTMTPIEAALALNRDFALEDLAQVEVSAHPVSIRVAGNPSPRTEAQAKFSIPYCVATALVKGEVTQENFSAQSMIDSELNRVIGLIRLRVNHEAANDNANRAARVTLHLRDGTLKTAEAKNRKGDPENPLTDRERELKFMDLASPVWGMQKAHKIWRKLPKLTISKDVRAWWRLLQGLKVKSSGPNDPYKGMRKT